ncbi:hypothetical protein RJ639_041004, partial [Escallonia herrerae]
PPAFARETPESIKEYIEEKYLLPRLDSDEFSSEKAGRQWEFDWFDKAQIHLEPSMPRSVVAPAWELPFRRPRRGLEKWEPRSVEVDVSDLVFGGEDLGSLPRIAGPAQDFVKGSINNRLFRPGGLEDSQSVGRILPDGASNGEWVWEVLSGSPAEAIAPSFKQGVNLGNLKVRSYSWNVQGGPRDLKQKSETNLNELSVQFDDLFKKAWEEDVVDLAIAGDASESDVEANEHENAKSESVLLEAQEDNLDVAADVFKTESFGLDEILSVESGASISRLDGGSNSERQLQPKEAWAVSGGSEGIADRFHELVPDMALDFPFNLDAFQKEMRFLKTFSYELAFFGYPV